MTTSLDQPVSVFKDAHTTGVLETVSLGAMLRRIQDGTYQYAVAYVREQLDHGAKAYKQAKEQLVAFTPCCAMTTRDRDVPLDQKLVSCVGITHYDFDDVPNLHALTQSLIRHPATVFCFVSPKGTGLKVGIAATGITDGDSYKHAWAAVLARLKTAYPAVTISEDPAVKYVNALCFVSDDPHCFINADAVPLAIPASALDEGTPPEAAPSQTESPADYATVASALAAIPNTATTGYDTWLHLGMALHSTGQPWARALWDGWSMTGTKFERSKQEKSWRSFGSQGKDRLVTVQSIFALAREHGWRRPQTPLGDAQQRTNGHTPPDEPHHWHGIVRRLDDDPEEDVRWQWEPYLALGKLHLLDGDPGTGKTLLMCAIAATLSVGGLLPDQGGTRTVPVGPPQRALFVAMEDNLADTIRPRVRKAGGDVSMIHVLNEIEDDKGHVRLFTLDHLSLLEDAIRDHAPRLVYIDSLQGVMGAKVDIHRANQVLPLMHALADLAAKYDVALVATRHPSKPGQNMARLIHRGMGSQAFMGTARLALYVDDHPTDRTKSILVQSKSNAGHPAMTQVFSKAHGVFAWSGTTRLTAAILGGVGHGPDPHALAEACLWLEEQLSKGRTKAATELQEAAKEEDLAWRSLMRAKKELGILATKLGEKWFWTLPPLPTYTYTTMSSLSSLSSLSSCSSWHPSTKTTPCGDEEGRMPEGDAESREDQETQECQECQVVTDAGVVDTTTGELLETSTETREEHEQWSF